MNRYLRLLLLTPVFAVLPSFAADGPVENTYPATALPWGMNFWTPQTGKMGDGWTYCYDADKIRGFKQTHQPSPWMNDYGQFSIMPATGKVVFDQDQRASWFSHKAETAKPHYYRTYLADHDVTVELTPTERAAFFRLTYPASDSSYVIIDAFDRGSYIKVIPQEKKIVGYTTKNSGGVPDNFKNWFVAVFDKPFDFFRIVRDGEIIAGENEAQCNHAGAVAGFSTVSGEIVHVRIASSFISLEQAERNLMEIGDRSFDEVAAAGKKIWNETLGRIEIEDGDMDNLRTFYSCLYRSLLFPRAFHETDAEGKTVHYSPYNGEIREGYMFTDTGFWDTFRSLFPLVNLVYPSMGEKMQEGLVNAWLESGFLPEWASPGHRDCMVGNNSASVVADAYIKGLRGYDIETLWEALIHDADAHLEGTASGRKGYEWYNRLGYIPDNVGIGQNVARTLEYAYNDWTIYTLGKMLGKPESEIKVYADRALNYRNVYNPDWKLMCGRDDKGNFDPDFDPADWSEAFCEGNSWHWSFCVFHDPQGLMDLMGGKDEMNAMMDSVFVLPGKLGIESRGIIHEMREMQIMDMGQYAHGNQPIQHMVYLYNYSGQPWKAQYWIREIMDKLYSATPDGYCGDEDNGQTSAWYVFSALGFYPVCPGTDQYVIGSPLFKSAKIHLENGKTVTVSAENNGRSHRYISRISLNGKPYGKNYLTHSDLLSGADIDMEMSTVPDTGRGTSDDAAPYSFSGQKNSADKAVARDYSHSGGLLEYVDPYIGSGGHGHVFVGTSVPYGMVQLGPSNIHKGWDWCSGYHYSDSVLIGFSHTHLSGTGCTDLGDILVMPMNEVRTPRGNQDDFEDGYASLYSHDTEIVRPEYYSVMVERYGIKAELTSTDRVGFHRYTYPEGKPASLLIDLREGNGSNAYESYIRQIDDCTVEGYRYVRGWSPSRKVYFVLKSDTPIASFTAYDDNDPQPGNQLRTASVKSVLGFGNVGRVKIKVALSSVSCENAAMNLDAELPHWSFDRTVDENASRWNAQLQKMTVETDDEKSRKIFYTALYHTMIAPTLYCDVNGEYRGMDDMIYTDPEVSNYSTLSLWDTYRTLHPLMTLIQPEMVDRTVNSMISIYRQQDKLPVWPLMSGETNQMPGYSSVPVIADAYLKGFEGFDAEEAFAAMKATATYRHQKGVPYVMEKGCIPADKIHEATSIALEYAVDDWGIAAMAGKMGKTEDAAVFAERAGYYRNYFDSSIGFVRPKLDDGTWRTPYDPARSIHTVGDFCEGNGWQYTFFVPQDPYGLISLFGGDKPFTAKLDSFFTNTDSMGDAPSNDITGLIGQYAHGNEPSHHIAYLYNYAGEQWKAAEKVRFIMDEFYTDRPDGLIGNEDCGQMSAWYLMSAMGFYQMNPSDGVFVFGSPRFRKVEMKVRGGKTFTVEAPDNSPENIYIRKVYLNGKPYKKSYITYQDIIEGGTLTFVMGKKPDRKFGTALENRPIVLSPVPSPDDGHTIPFAFSCFPRNV